MTIKIFRNYGILGMEKEVVYTHRIEARAICSDEIEVVIPDGWELSRNIYDEPLWISPWGWAYQINDVLGQHRSRPAFKALDPDMQEKIYYLYTPEEIKKNRI